MTHLLKSIEKRLPFRGLRRGLADRIREKLRRRRERRRFPRKALESLVANDSVVLEALAHLAETTRQERERQAERHRRLEERQRELVERFEVNAKLGRCVLRGEEPVGAQESRPSRLMGSTIATRRYRLLNPELDLLSHLAPMLAARTAVDVGAHEGEFSEALLDLGLAVHAFEPYPPTFERLQARLGRRSGFVAHPIAVGREDGELTLHVPEVRPGSPWGEASLYCSLVEHALPEGELLPGPRLQVPVRSLESLHRTGDLPPRIGLLKVDAEGFDLEILRGMGAQDYAVVVSEYWDRDFTLGRSGALNGLSEQVAEMRRRGYAWHLAIFRIDGDWEIRYFTNLSTSVEHSWGNLLFFREHELFEAARRWCEGTLPRARFCQVPEPKAGGQEPAEPPKRA